MSHCQRHRETLQSRHRTLSFYLLFHIYIVPVPIIVAWHFTYAIVSLDQISYGSNILQTSPSERSLGGSGGAKDVGGRQRPKGWAVWGEAL